MFTNDKLLGRKVFGYRLHETYKKKFYNSVIRIK